MTLGVLEGHHVELIQGDIVTMPSRGSLHAMTVLRLAEALRPMFSLAAGFLLRQQMPLRLIGVDTEPEPDLAVVTGTLDDYPAAHPTTALLVVEVAETLLAYDRDLFLVSPTCEICVSGTMAAAHALALSRGCAKLDATVLRRQLEWRLHANMDRMDLPI